MAIHFENGLLGFNVFCLDLLLGFTGMIIGHDAFAGGDLRDFLNAFSIKDVHWIKLRYRRLFQRFDGNVIKHIAVQVFTDHANHCGTKCFTFVIQFNKIHLLASCFERFSELSGKQLVELFGA